MKDGQNLAVRHNGDETIIAVLKYQMTQLIEDPLATISEAVTKWGVETKVGRETIGYTGGDFNFGDLAVCADIKLAIYLKQVGIVNLEVMTYSSLEEGFNFDTNLFKGDLVESD